MKRAKECCVYIKKERRYAFVLNILFGNDTICLCYPTRSTLRFTRDVNVLFNKETAVEDIVPCDIRGDSDGLLVTDEITFKSRTSLLATLVKRLTRGTRQATIVSESTQISLA